MRSTDGGATFENIHDIGPDSPAVVGNNYISATPGWVYGIFAAYPPDSYLIRSSDGGTTWSDPIRILDTVLFIDNEAIPVRSDTLVGLGQKIPSTNQITFSIDGGLSWSKQVRPAFPLTGTAGYDPDLALSAGKLHLAVGYEFNPSGTWQRVVQYRSSTDLGLTWSDSVAVSDVQTGYADEPSLAVEDQCDGPHVVVAWRDAKYGCWALGGCSIIARDVSDQVPARWPTESLLTPMPMGFGPVTRMAGDVVVIGWGQFDDIDKIHPMVRVSFDGANNWCPPVQLPAENPLGWTVSMAVTKKAIHVLWEEDAGGFRIMYQRGRILPSGSGFTMLGGDVAFDSTDIGESREQSVSVRNDGTADLVINWIRTTFDCFTVSPASLSIAPGGVGEFHVRFTPTGFGERIGKVTFHHNDLEHSPFCIGVSGTGRGHDLSVSYSGGWNLVSDPLRNEIKTGLPNLFSYDGSYAHAEVMEFGRGYWAKAETTMVYSGGYVWSDTISVNAKWNIIGGLSGPVPVSAIGSIPAGIIDSPFYGFVGKYVESDTLCPGRGYWVKVREGGRLTLNSVTIGGSGR